MTTTTTKKPPRLFTVHMPLTRSDRAADHAALAAKIEAIRAKFEYERGVPIRTGRAIRLLIEQASV